MTSQDFNKGIDITGLTAVTGSEMNQLIDAGKPASDKGLIIETRDTGINTPVVPDPNTLLEGITPTQWTRYIWKRVGFSVDDPIKHYSWNPQLSFPNIIYLNWQWIERDSAQAIIDAAAALALATTANSNAATALTAATTAENTATTAQTTAEAAQITANIALSQSNTNTTNITTLQTTVTGLSSSVATLQTEIVAVNALVRRVPLGSVYFREQYNSGVNGVASTAGVWIKRIFNHIENDNSNLVGYATLNGDSTIDLVAGIWSIEGEFPCNGGVVGQYHKTKVVDDTAVADILFGSSEYADTTLAATKSKIVNYLEIHVLTKIEIQHQASQTVPNAFGVACSMGPEIYGQLKLSYLGSV